MTLSDESQRLPDQILIMATSSSYRLPHNTEPKPGASRARVSRVSLEGVETRPNKLNPEVKEILTENSDLKCMFCKLSTINSIEWGPMYNLGKITIHYFCMLFSCGLEQNGDDQDGIMGFLPKDLENERIRAGRLKCKFCKLNGANIGCGISRCGMSYHYTCGYRKNVLFQFYGQYQSYCSSHKISKQVHIPENCNTTCIICLERISYADEDAVWATCCEKNIFHRLCLMKYAVNSAYYFKCPLCNSQKRFKQASAEQGVYIPDDEATWEQEPNAFREQQVAYSKCDVEPCICPNGRDFKEKKTHRTTDWQIIRCNLCASSAAHRRCGRILGFKWKCEICSKHFAALMSEEEDIESEESSSISAIVGPSPKIESEEPFLMVNPSEVAIPPSPLPTWDNIQIKTDNEYVRTLSAILKMREACRLKATISTPIYDKLMKNSNFKGRLEELKGLFIKEHSSYNEVAGCQSLSKPTCQTTHNDPSPLDFFNIGKPKSPVGTPQNFSVPPPNVTPNEVNSGLSNVQIKIHGFEENPIVKTIVKRFKNLYKDSSNLTKCLLKEALKDQSKVNETELDEDNSSRKKIKRKLTVKERNRVRKKKRVRSERNIDSSSSDEGENIRKSKSKERTDSNPKKLYQEEKIFEQQNSNIFKSSSSKIKGFKIPLKPSLPPRTETVSKAPPIEPDPERYFDSLPYPPPDFRPNTPNTYSERREFSSELISRNPSESEILSRLRRIASQSEEVNKTIWAHPGKAFHPQQLKPKSPLQQEPVKTNRLISNEIVFPPDRIRKPTRREIEYEKIIKLYRPEGQEPKEDSSDIEIIEIGSDNPEKAIQSDDVCILSDHSDKLSSRRDKSSSRRHKVSSRSRKGSSRSHKVSSRRHRISSESDKASSRNDEITSQSDETSTRPDKVSNSKEVSAQQEKSKVLPNENDESDIEILGECVGGGNVAIKDKDEIEIIECKLFPAPSEIGISRALQNVLNEKTQPPKIPEKKPRADGIENMEIVSLLLDDDDDEPCIVGGSAPYWQAKT